jgi:catechol 2,3-dioxygenase-like lactoylglutathione lyase family enzyme
VGTRLSHVFLLTSDVDAMRRLLVDVLGLEILVEDEGYLRVGGRRGFHLGIEEGDPGPANSMELAIEVEDVEDTYQRASDAGVRFEGPPVRAEWGARHAWFTDHDGRRMSIFTPTPSAGT